jgi:peptide/nickel transport system permease protein
MQAFRRPASSRGGQVGLVLVGLVALVAMVGPLASPYSPTEIVGRPFAPPSVAHWLGTDSLGRDGLSRFLWGGRALLLVALLGTLIPYCIGVPAGMAAGYSRRALDIVVVGVSDVLNAFPPIIFVLVLLAATGPTVPAIIAGIAAIHLPRVLRLTRLVTIDVAKQPFVEAAVARGEKTFSILIRDILPSIWTPLLTDFGIRLTGSVITFASLSYLGLGQAPPAADWGSMISDNRGALTLSPWIIIAPALMISAITVGVNLAADTTARSMGRSLTQRGV